MAAPDWLSYWGAGLSTVLAVREVLKHRRATRPRLIGYVARSASGGVVLSSRDILGETKIEGRMTTLHNQGGAATTIRQYGVFIAPGWCPRVLLAVLGEFGIAPRSRAMLPEPLEEFPLPEADVAAGKEQTFRVLLTPTAVEALNRGRLMLNVLHTWSRDRPQQVSLTLAD